jgi:integrase
MMMKLNADDDLVLNNSGYWKLKLPAERGEDGKWRSRSRSCGTKDFAEAQAFKHAFVTMNSTPPGQVTIGNLIDAYQDHARDRGVTAAQFWVLKPVSVLLGSYRPEDLTLDLQRAYSKQRKVSPGSLRRELGALRTVLNWAIKHKKLDRAQNSFIELPDQPSARKVWLNEVDEARLWSIAAEDRDSQGRLGLAGLFVCLALGTGARSGAIYALTWDRVDLTTGKIDFRVPDERETRKRKVSTVINTRLLSVLRCARADYPFSRKVLSHAIRYRLENFLKQHGFEHVTPHVFRHTFVTLSLRAGTAIWDVAELAGMSANMVQKVYGHHVADDRLRAEANRRFT